MRGLRSHILEAVRMTTRLLSPNFDFAANRASPGLDQHQPAWRVQRAA